MKKFTYLLLFFLVNTAFLKGFGQTSTTSNSIGDFVWRDINCDGIQQAGEPGIGGVRVTVTYPNGTTTATTTTNSNGFYSFSNLPAGNYVFTFTTPSGYTPSPSNKGGDITKDSDARNGKVSVTVYANESNPCIDAGFCGPVSTSNNNTVGNFVWHDLNCDGIQQANEPGIGGVKVTITYPNGTTTASTITNSNGNYSFSNLPAGNYVFTFSTPSGYTASPSNKGTDITKDSDPVNGKVNVTVYANEDNPCIDAGFCKTTNHNNSVGNFVWRDLDCDGLQDTGEPGLSGVLVTITYPDGVTTAQAITNSTGFYQFTNLAPGNYVFSFTTPSGFKPSPADRGNDITRDSDPVNGKVTVSVYANENNPCIDAGFCVLSNTAILGDFVWRDTNCDGIQQAGEPGIAGVQVTLTYPDGVTTATTTTSSTGFYQFSNLPAGNYVVSFATPAGYSPSPADRGGDITKDSDAVNGKVAVTVYAGENNPCIDAGFCFNNYNNSVGDFVWHDLNCDGIQQAGEPGIAGVKVTITYPDGVTTATTTTNASGFYQFTNLAPGSYVFTFETPAGYKPSPADQGNDITKDSDPINGKVTVLVYANDNNPCIDAGFCQVTNSTIGDFVFNDLNGNGLQDTDEPGIAGVTVTLTLPNGTTQTTTTNANGQYSFNNLPAGTYKVCFSTPTGTTPSPANQGTDDTRDSDPVNGCVTITLAANEVNNTVDAGFIYPKSSIGDFVFKDLNRNGIQDAGEPGIAGVTVTLTGTNGFTATTTTNVSGLYQFTNLNAGTYTVCFQVPIPQAFMPSPANQGTDDTRDSDPVNGCVTVTLVSGENNNTVDAGFYDDIDDDDDGITDIDENGGFDVYGDCDGDGIPNHIDPTPGCPGLVFTDCPMPGFPNGDGINDFFDFDKDGVINSLDLDSDNDGILDVQEARDPRAVDANNDGMVDGNDDDGDGLNNSADQTPNSYGGPGLVPQDLDRDGLPNFLDLDSDGDGITDLTEATGSFDSDGIVNGPDTDGDGVRDLADGIPGRGATGVGLRDSDRDGIPNPYDIDSDQDGITDNVEGQPTCSYAPPTGSDNDKDGVDNAYDLNNDTCPPSAAGINPFDKDGDGTPDIYDLDTDNDLAPDVNEGSGIFGNFVTQTGDADGDGLIDQFDIFNIKTTTSKVYTSNVVHSQMGPNGNFNGPVPAGSNAKLPKSQEGGCAEGVDRDWRNVQILPVTLLEFKGNLNSGNVRLTWTVANELNMSHYIVERSSNGTTYKEVGQVRAHGNATSANYVFNDNVGNETGTIYYRLVQVESNGKDKRSNVITFKLQNKAVNSLAVHPNPANSFFVVKLNATKDGNATIRIVDLAGRVVIQQNNRITTGSNAITFNNIDNIAAGTYNVQVMLNDEVLNQKLVVVK